MNLPALQHETRDASPRTIGLVGVVLGAALLLFWTLAQLWYRHEIAGQARAGEMLRQSSFTHSAGERLPILVDRAQATLEADAHLRDAGWVDQSAGVAHISIERAMQLVAQERAGASAGKSSAP